MRSRIIRTAIVLGVTLGTWVFALTFLVVTYLPAIFGILIPIGILGLPLVLMWPSRFDQDLSVKWPTRLGHRMGAVVVGALVGGLVSFLIVLALPQYITWSDNQYRATLRKRGMADTEIELQVAAHRQTPFDHLSDGLYSVGVPSTLAALVTTAAGAVMFRRRPTP